MSATPANSPGWRRATAAASLPPQLIPHRIVGSELLRACREYVGDVVDPRLPVVDVAQLFAVEAGAAAIEKCDFEAAAARYSAD